MLTKRKRRRQIQLRVNNRTRRAAQMASGRPRRAAVKTVEQVAAARLPTEYGEFRIIGYRSLTSE
jgi:hypothetical protein